MAVLPTVGASNNIWGAQLLTWFEVAHLQDGRLSVGGVAGPAKAVPFFDAGGNLAVSPWLTFDPVAGNLGIGTGAATAQLNTTTSVRFQGVAGAAAAPLAIDASGNLSAPQWTAWTPAFSPQGGGSFGSVGGSPSAIAQYLRIGSFVFFFVWITIPDCGTAAGSLLVPLPPGYSPSYAVTVAGREYSAQAMIQGVINAGNTVMTIMLYNATSPFRGSGVASYPVVAGYFLA